MFRLIFPMFGFWLALFWNFAPAPALAQAIRVQPASHPALIDAELPPLIPAETFFSTAREAWDHRISPDGQKLLWIALKDGKPAIHFRHLEGGEVTSTPAERAVRWGYWPATAGTLSPGGTTTVTKITIFCWPIRKPPTNLCATSRHAPG